MFNVTPSVHYFYVKTRTFADFQICINVPLNERRDEIQNLYGQINYNDLTLLFQK